MKTKTVYWIIGTIIVIALGYWIYTKYYKTTPSVSNQRSSLFVIFPKPNQSYACVSSGGGQCSGASSTNADGSCTQAAISAGCQTIGWG